MSSMAEKPKTREGNQKPLTKAIFHSTLGTTMRVLFANVETELASAKQIQNSLIQSQNFQQHNEQQNEQMASVGRNSLII